MPVFTIDQRKIYYEKHDKGEWIILLHHGFGCIKMWKEIYPIFLDAGYGILMHDRRGYGRSDEGGEDFVSFYKSDRFREENVRDMALLLDHLGVDSFHLVGQCEGGVIAIDYANAYPQQVKTVTTGSTQCFCEVTTREMNRVVFPKAFHELEPDLQEKFTQWHGDKAEFLFNLFCDEGGAYGTGCFDIRPSLPSVYCPTLVLYPDRSKLFEVEQAVAFYRHLPAGELAVFPMCGHNTYEQRPEEYVRTILDFLDRSRVAPGRYASAGVKGMGTCLATPGPVPEKSLPFKT